jgi:hypothetical protein
MQARVDWAVLPSGVRFDPSDEELLEHLLAKVGHGSSKEHPLINDFILTLDEEDGICRTHPENLPGRMPPLSAGNVSVHPFCFGAFLLFLVLFLGSKLILVFDCLVLQLTCSSVCLELNRGEKGWECLPLFL